jgi:phosphoadenosine phosphosulfate reductase
MQHLPPHRQQLLARAAATSPDSRDEASADLAALVRRLQQAAEVHSRIVFASSFGAEDMVILHAIAHARLPIGVLTLDTGKLPQECLDLIAHSEAHYAVEVRRIRPRAERIDWYVRSHGEHAFYETVELRKLCCSIRKVEPLAAALNGYDAWVTGVRRDQAASREATELHAFDPQFGLNKWSPLFDWTETQVWRFLHAFEVPYNALHDKGYPSIGCAPCTRALKPGEDARAGRWWWESNRGQTECGLHTAPGEASQKRSVQ